MNKLTSDAEFHWAGGIENTFIPQERPGLRALEEYTLTQHYAQWRDDLTRAASLGISKLRWGPPWYRVESKPNQFDWSWTDEVLDFMVNRLHIDPILDLVHYGTPLWLEDSFADPRYPQYVSRYAQAFAQRYRHLVRWYTPLNEPTVNADLAGRRALWPPYMAGDAGFVTVLIAIARGIQQTIQAVSSVQSDASYMAVEAMAITRARDEKSRHAADLEFRKDLLCWDLVRGVVDEHHPLHSWLLVNGAKPEHLAELRANPCRQDVLGVNFYPWSLRDVQVDASGKPVFTPGQADGRQLADVLRRCHQYARQPLFVTETSCPGDVTRRGLWMSETIDAVRTARGEGIPVLGYTWFPLFTMIEWDYRLTNKPPAEHLLHLGLWDAAFDQAGTLVRHENRLVNDYRDWIRRGMTAPCGARAGCRSFAIPSPRAMLRRWYHRLRRLAKQGVTP